MVDLDFKFISKEHYNCIENVLATLMTTWDREYTLMFSRNWGFAMLPGEHKNDLLGYRIGGGIYNVWECLNEYEGVETTEVHGDIKLQREVLNNLLAEGKPVIVEMDGYYAPWKDVYFKYHTQHFCLVVGQLEDGYGCLDPYVNSDINLLPYNFFDMAQVKCIMIEAKEKKQQIDLYKLLKDATDIILMEEEEISGIAGMLAFGDKFEMEVDLQAEKAGYEDMIWMAPMVFRLSDIGSRRLNFSETLSSLYKRFGYQELEDIRVQVEKAGWVWRRIRRTVISEMYTPQNNQKKKIGGMIRNVALAEEETAKSILKFLEKGDLIGKEKPLCKIGK